MSISDVMAVAALIIALVSAWYTRRMVQIESGRDRETRREASKASLEARLDDKTNMKILVITNKGPAVARNVRIFLDGNPLSQWMHTNQAVGPEMRNWPDSLAILSVNGEKRFGFMDDCVPKDATLEWEDASGDPGCTTTNLRHG